MGYPEGPLEASDRPVQVRAVKRSTPEDTCAAMREEGSTDKKRSLLLGDARLCSKKDLARCMRNRRQMLRIVIGVLLLIYMVGLISVFSTMITPDEPGDLRSPWPGG